jgi:hypothetical protein
MPSKEISNSEDIIDSRDIIERIEELREKMSGACIVPEGSDWATAGDCSAHAHMDGWDELDEELKQLLALQEEAEGYSGDWKYGATLIRDSYFEEYAKQLADDIGAIDSNASWPLYCIDWERAAADLQQDYTSVDYDGVTYWVR